MLYRQFFQIRIKQKQTQKEQPINLRDPLHKKINFLQFFT